MRYLLHDLMTMRKNRVVYIIVCDCFAAEVKILKNRGYKWFVEIINASMCYPQLVPYKGGERMWIYRKDLYRTKGDKQ